MDEHSRNPDAPGGAPGLPAELAPATIEDANDLETVIGLARAALAAEDYEDFSRIVETHGVAIAMREPERIQELLDAVPEEVLADYPMLAMGKNSISTFFDQAKPRGSLDLASLFADTASTGTPVGDLVLVGIGQILALRATGQLASGRAIVERDRARVEAARADWLEVPAELRTIALLQWGLTRMLAQDLGGALQDFQESYWAGRRSRSPFFARNSAVNAALVLALLDSIDDAEEWLAKGRELSRRPEEVSHIVEEWDPLVEALIAMARLDLDDARAALGRFRPAQDTELSWSIEHFVEARLGLLGDERFAALDGLARAHHPRGGGAVAGSFDEALLTIAEAELCLAVGRTPRATVLAGHSDGGPLFSVVRARLALLSGDAPEALARAVAGLHRSDLFGRIDLLGIKAVATLRMDRPSEAGEQFRQALELSRAHGVVAPLALLPRADVQWLVDLVPESGAALGPVLALLPGSSPANTAIIDLSDREKLVLVELAHGGSTQQIAERLFVSVNTVKTQVRSIYRKLGVTSREEAIAAAHRWGFALGRPGH